MNKMNFLFMNFTMVFTLSLGFAGCSSGSGSDDATDDDTLYSKSISGLAIDGYISGATVCVDVNNNNLCDANEPQSTTLSDGSFTFNANIKTGAHTIIVLGGTDIATGQTFRGILKYVIEVKEEDPLASFNVTPMTTVATHRYKKIIKSNPNYTIDNAKQDIATSLGLTFVQISANPLNDKDLLIKTQQIMHSTKILQKNNTTE